MRSKTTFRQHHDLMKEVKVLLDSKLAGTRLGICHTNNQIWAMAKEVTHKIERSVRGDD
jgi:hypothetical protein